MTLDQILALVAQQVTNAYNQGVTDGVAKIANPVLALVAKLKTDVEALVNPPAPPSS